MALYDYGIVGAGIVGLATAKALTEKNLTNIIIFDSEEHVAAHQTGHNSGVIHAGLYYMPGSQKAKNCTQGRMEMEAFCQQENIPYERCGKLVVATKEEQLEKIDILQQRGKANGLEGLKIVPREALKDYEPHVVGLKGLWVPHTGIVDYKEVANKMAALIQSKGAHIQSSTQVIGLRFKNGIHRVQTTKGVFECRYLINCGGLECDRVAKMAGLKVPIKIVPFRGDYYELVESRRSLVKNLIYPVPDPRFPFLGVHFTRRIDGRIEAGPNAVLSLKREGYSRFSFSVKDAADALAYRGLWSLFRKYYKEGMKELMRSFSKNLFVKSLQELVPECQTEDVSYSGCGIRAQALSPNGALIDDFMVLRGEKMFHVLNAPSPAATASLSIGKWIASEILEV